MLQRRAGSLLAALLALTMEAAGGGDSGNGKLSAEDFADQSCPDFTDWAKSLQAVVSGLRNLGADTDSEPGKKKLSSALGDLDRATGRLGRRHRRPRRTRRRERRPDQEATRRRAQ